MKLLLATGNQHKRTEFGRLLPGVELELLPEDIVLPPEVGETFAENASLKAHAVASATGRITVADDSGIGAAALNGAPGVRSARYAGENASDQQNLAKLLAEVSPGDRLTYTCALVVVDPTTDTEALFVGECHGRLAAEPVGSGGFGYDPVFLPNAIEDGRTVAELSDAKKDTISHRGIAARQLIRWLASR